jgi:DNA mismatch repair ATPase MutS
LGPPLIPAAVRVRNVVAIEGKTRVLLVSGSNMSGMCPLLRTIGIITVLATKSNGIELMRSIGLDV